MPRVPAGNGAQRGKCAVLRFVGLVFLSLGFAVLASDIARSGETDLRLSALGEWWYWLSPGSLQLLQPAVERHISPALWDPGIQTLLEWSLAAELFALAGLCFVLSAIRRDRGVSRSA
jgi:hypothetical protein